MNTVITTSLLATALLTSSINAFSGAFTIEEAAKRDNKFAWSNIQRLKGPAWELSSIDHAYSPAYWLFRTRKDCIVAMVDTGQDTLTSECHPVKPHQKPEDFWSVMVFSDPSATKMFTETRFADHERCTEAAALVRPDSYTNFAGICVNFGTKSGPEIGE